MSRPHLIPQATPWATVGCCKTECWKDHSPSSGEYNREVSPTFRDILLARAAPPAIARVTGKDGLPAGTTSDAVLQAPDVVSQVAPAASLKVPPRIVLLPSERVGRVAAQVADADGWVTVEGRRARQERR